VLYVVGREDCIHRIRGDRRHICHGSNQIGLNGLVDVKAKLTPVSKASGGAVLALGATAYVEKGFHGEFCLKTPYTPTKNPTAF
jgi:hypothetical protein